MKIYMPYYMNSLRIYLEQCSENVACLYECQKETVFHKQLLEKLRHNECTEPFNKTSY